MSQLAANVPGFRRPVEENRPFLLVKWEKVFRLPHGPRKVVNSVTCYKAGRSLWVGASQQGFPLITSRSAVRTPRAFVDVSVTEEGQGGVVVLITQETLVCHL